MIQRLITPLGSVVAAILAAASTEAQSVRTGHATAELVANVASITPGDSFHVALRLQPDSGWHVYWSNPGDAGMPPSLDGELPGGWKAGPLLFPVPERFETPPLASYGYKDDVWYPMSITTAGGSPAGRRVSLRARAEWLICREECLPEAADFTLTLAVGETVPHTADAARVSDALARLPRPAPDWNGTAVFEDSVVVLSWDATNGFAAGQEAYFFPAEQGVLLHAGSQILSVEAGRARLTIPRDDVQRARPDTLRGVLALGSGDGRRGYALAPAARDVGAGGPSGFLPALLAGLLSLAVLILIFVLKRPHVGGAR
jgi:thiol:disulfide interchange protein DsbD